MKGSRSRQRTICGVAIGVALALLLASAIVFRRDLLTKYYAWRLPAAEASEQWEIAAKLRGLGSPVAEEWYLARLTEAPHWTEREKAARFLAERISAESVRALLALEHPEQESVRRAENRSPGTSPSAGVFFQGYNLRDILPASTTADTQDRLIRFLQARSGRGFWSKSTHLEFTRPATLFVSAPLTAHQALGRVLETTRFTHRLLRESNPRTLDELELLSRDREAEPWLRDRAAVELRAIEHPASAPIAPGAPVPIVNPVR